MMLIASLAVLTSAISPPEHDDPSSDAHLPRMRAQSASLCAALGDCSSRSISAFTRSLTMRGQAPRPAVLK